MTIKKDGEKWLVDLYPEGRGSKRVRKKFDTRAEAARFEKFVLSAVHQGKDWNTSKRDSRHLNELIDIWYKAKGSYLKDGPRRRKCLLDISEWLGNPKGIDLKAINFTAYLSYKTESGISEKTINNHLGYMNAVYNYLSDVGEIEYSNPLAKIKPIKIDERELSWLTTEQIRHLLSTIESFSQNQHVLLLTKICLATGARWSEAEGLKLRHVRDGKLSFHGTKSGKSRSVPVAENLFNEIHAHLEKCGEFSFSLSAFRRALDESGIELPKGQAAHVLRHTFASHFMMNGGNILTLQRALGHSSVTITMRYAHLSPEHLQDVVLKGPLS
ncbi:tyrosine-type recombinase/integrase [Thalassolituus sp. ST750PaO-4]|uniref:phage integrase n=1 Tax=Thalassolituus sp. ST750PaO-4 TaxID=2742965 RepID=UPI001CE37E93|nr:tyrosine-type recombinase/integrase [Thalassolituus sp. ST750PaO-4]MCA6061684.1 tyrosine-type recombinase/integrase [Thalassolituus sp. ST750PaO-4]